MANTMRSARETVSGERGAALLIVLAFMVLLLILISTMLAVGSNEAVISGLQRDGVQALEHAQAGLEEAVRRIEAGRPYSAPFTGSVAPGVQVQVVTREIHGHAHAELPALLQFFRSAFLRRGL